MIAVRLLTRPEYSQLLKRFGCELVDELKPKDGPNRYYGWAYWKTAWGHHFYVPEIGPDAMCPEHRFYDILSEISSLAPKEGK